MKTLTVMRCRQVARFAGFLEKHPGFSPELFGENASVIGFRLGRSLLSVDEMERLIDAPVCERTAVLLRNQLPAANGRM